jgi:hypothetical protein
MTFTKLALIIFISFWFSSCNWRTKEKNEKKNSIVQKDTSHLVNLLKSYEPKVYHGKVPKQFYTNRGAFDWWRFPLVYPYSIGCIDVTEYGSIYNDKDKTDFDAGGSIQPLTDYFDKFTFDSLYFVASKFKDPFNKDQTPILEQYFIFSFSNGTIEEISGKQSLYKKLREIKFVSDTSFMTIRGFGNKL